LCAQNRKNNSAGELSREGGGLSFHPEARNHPPTSGAYLRQIGAPYQRSCCEAGVISDRTRVGHEAPGWVCRNWDVFVEFKFAGKDESVAAPEDTLQQIDLFQNGSCL
jgi:hypothetical protein